LTTPAPAATATSESSIVATSTNEVAPVGASAPDGKGCLLGWLDALLILFK